MDVQTIEKIVRRVVKEVLQEMYVSAVSDSTGFQNKSERIDFNGYKTPVLTERSLLHLHELTGEIVIPKKTVITPKAHDVIREKGIKIKRE